jgi:hypothetical protein
MTPEQIAIRDYPGFTAQPPAKQEEIIRSIRMRMAAAEQQQPKQPSTADQAGALTGQVAGTAGGAYAGGALMGSGGAAASTPVASTAGTSIGADWAGAMGANSVAAPSVLANFGAMGVGPQAGIVAGTAMTAQGVKDLVDGKKSDTATRAQTALSTFGFSEMARLAGFGNRKTTKQRQAEEIQQTVKNDDNYKKYIDQAKTNNPGGDKNANVAGDFVGNASTGWTNNKFAETGNAADLAPEDIWGNATVVRTMGKDWLGKATEQQRRAAAQELLNAGLIDPEKGGFVVTDEAKAQQIFADVMSGKIKAKDSDYAAYQNPTAQNPQGSNGGRITINVQGSPVTKPAVADAREAQIANTRSNLLQNMLAKTSQPIQYPQQSGAAQATSFNDTLNKIIGG